MASLRFVSANIWLSRTIDLVQKFLADNEADVVCVQELRQRDVPLIAGFLGGAQHMFVPMALYPFDDGPDVIGVGIFSRVPMVRSWARYYNGNPARIVEMNPRAGVEEKHETIAGVLALCDIEKDNATFRIATTHFTWAPDGLPDAFQRTDVAAMLHALDNEGELILCGDFNAPRTNRDGTPGEIFSTIASRYTDNVPAEYTTSIDGAIHRAGQLPYMVDGLFSTPSYAVSDVALHSGVSDHMAITATVSRA
ncbi:endonuclease/exonuclease/phosphatase family protein [Candidatus Kaiserbacteria bacterium]|nr:endonuclease/exonuclease/phosphatase family protein [Candidatus Kaiserbacteria bacterium]